MQTEITRLLGIKYPIIQGGMAWVAEHHLAAAVSEAGGLGLIGAASAPAEWVREQIRAARKLTDKPFGVNIMLMSPYAADVAKVIVEEGVQVVTTGAGSPGKVERSRSESNSCCCFGGSCKTYGAGRSRRNCCRRLRVWRTCRREHDYDTCTTGR